VPYKDLQQASELLAEALYIRSKYMALSLQNFCPTTENILKTVHNDYDIQRHLKKKGMVSRSYEDVECKLADFVRYLFMNCSYNLEITYIKSSVDVMLVLYHNTYLKHTALDYGAQLW
jgi:hypothetical protein